MYNLTVDDDENPPEKTSTIDRIVEVCKKIKLFCQRCQTN